MRWTTVTQAGHGEEGESPTRGRPHGARRGRRGFDDHALLAREAESDVARGAQCLLPLSLRVLDEEEPSTAAPWNTTAVSFPTLANTRMRSAVIIAPPPADAVRWWYR